MKKITYTLVFLILATSLAACDGVRRSDVGIAGGAVAGGLIGGAVTGSSTAGIVVGAAGGALIGREVARQYDY